MENIKNQRVNLDIKYVVQSTQCIMTVMIHCVLTLSHPIGTLCCVNYHTWIFCHMNTFYATGILGTLYSQ